MSHPISPLDRLRIERLVWSLDQQLYDLPRASRIAHRREVRVNLLAAARDVGTRPALRRLGSSRQLAEEYLTAELGDGPRPSWVTAAVFCAGVPLLLNGFFDEAARAYHDGIIAADAHATGSFTWEGISYLQSAVTYTFTDGQGSWLGGAWTPLTYLLWAAGTVLVGRLWRLWRTSRHRRSVRLAGSST